MKVSDLIKFLETLRREHYWCEDSYYNCPKHIEGCADSSKPKECDCGAELHNANIEAMINHLKQFNQII
jgi:hypothetical protein